MSYMTVDLGLLVGELSDLCGGHNIVNTGADVLGHIVSIVLYVDRAVLHGGCSLKHIPILQDALSLWGLEFNRFDDRI